MNPPATPLVQAQTNLNCNGPDAKRRAWYMYVVAFGAAVGGFLFGYDLSLIGAANVYLRDQFHLSPEMMGFTTASAALGCMMGPFLGAWLCDAIGRERTMIVASFLLAVGATMTALAQTVTLFNIFRVVGGVGVGLCSVASPMYIAEMSPHRMRGKLGTMYQLAIVVGSTVAPLIGYVLVDVFPPAVCWRWMFASQMVVVVVFALFLFLLPPSPRWLAQKGRQEEALAVLARVHGAEGAPIELRGINEAIAQETGGLAELMQPGIGFALLIGLLLAFFNNWTGWSAMGGYMTMLFEMAGVKERGTAILLFALTYLLMAILTVASMWLVDRVGRRPLWVTASILMGLFTALTGLVLQCQVHWAFLLMLFLCTVPHGLALGGLPWLMMSELFPNRIRAKAVAVTTTFLWLVIFTCAQFFPMIIDSSQRHLGSAAGAFWTCSIVCVCSTIFGLTMMPETRGRTLEEIGSSWRRR